MKQRTWFRVHSFTGVITGLMLFVICWSGTFMVLSHEIDWLVTPERRVEPSGETVSWGDIHRAVEETYSDATINRIIAPRYAYSVATVIIDRPRQNNVQVFVNPYTAEVQGTHSGFTVHEFFRKFHVRLFHVGGNGSYIGYYIVMSFSFVLMVSLVSALIFYSRWWTKFFTFLTGSARRFWSSLHKSAGLWSLWFILIMAVTGGWYFFEITRLYYGDGIYVYSGRGGYAAKQIPSPETTDQDTLPLDNVLESVDRTRPDFRIGTIQMPNQKGSMYVMGQGDDWFIRDWGNRVYLNAKTGEVLHSQDADDIPLYWYWSNMADPLHFGNFAGLYSKIVWFLFGLILCGMILTGTYLHVRRLAHESANESQHRWPGTWIAMGFTVSILLLMIPYSLETIKSFGPTINGIRHYPYLSVGIKAIIGSWIGITITILVIWIYCIYRPTILRISSES
jgi:uncharacterized iron-regulated membrane protein